jgi:ATP-dependent RNA helicase DDX24/MAK5
MSSNEHPHLNDFSCLKYLVIDEADRMVKQGNFPELEKIFEDINEEEDSEEEDSEEEDSEEEDSEEEESENSEDEEEEKPAEEDDSEEEMTEAEIEAFLGFNPEPATKMLSDDILASNEELKKTTKPSDIVKSSSSASSGNKPTNSHTKGKLDKTLRQTFIYSATLTLPPPAKKEDMKGGDKKKKGKRTKGDDENILETIMEKAGSKGAIKIVDLSVEGGDSTAGNTKASTKTTATGAKQKTVKLPPGLTLFQSRCTQLHKDSYTYAFLSTTAQGNKGPSIVFCNSIGGVKRVARTLEELGMQVRSLHADMPQVSRSLRSASLSCCCCCCCCWLGCDEEIHETPEQWRYKNCTC